MRPNPTRDDWKNVEDMLMVCKIDESNYGPEFSEEFKDICRKDKKCGDFWKKVFPKSPPVPETDQVFRFDFTKKEGQKFTKKEEQKPNILDFQIPKLEKEWTDPGKMKIHEKSAIQCKPINPEEQQNGGMVEKCITKPK